MTPGTSTSKGTVPHPKRTALESCSHPGRTLLGPGLGVTTATVPP